MTAVTWLPFVINLVLDRSTLDNKEQGATENKIQYGKTVLASEEGWVFSIQDIWNGGLGLGPLSEFDILNLDGGLLNQT